MEVIFKDIPRDFFKARVSEIREETGRYGPYLRLIFTIIDEGELSHYRFSGFIRPTSIRQSKFYRWVTNILGGAPEDKFCTEDMIGKECLVYLFSKGNNYYSVTDVFMKPEE